MRNLAFVALFALVLYALIDCARSEEGEGGGLPKAIWIVLIVLVPLMGAVAWLIVSRTGPGRERPAFGAGDAPRRPSGPVAPDDDPEFLWRLEQQGRRDAGQKQGERTEPEGDSGRG